MATIIQTTFTQREDIAVPGTLSEAYQDVPRVSSKHARGLVLAGYGVFKVPGVQGDSAGSFLESAGQLFHQPSQAVAAAVAAIVASRASSASPLVVSGTGLNGNIGASEMQPGRKVTVVLSNNANWLASNLRVKGISALTAQPISEVLAIPASGNVTLTTIAYFTRVTSVEFDAQGGTGGTFTVGVAALGSLGLADFLGISMRHPIQTGVFASNLYNMTGLPTGVEGNYIDGELVDFTTRAGIWVVTETAVRDQDSAYVRVAAGAGGSILGAFRNDADSGSAVLVPARFTRTIAAGKASLFLNLLG